MAATQAGTAKSPQGAGVVGKTRRLDNDRIRVKLKEKTIIQEMQENCTFRILDG
jgi:hypothetical protein